jgi:iodotyrosine deiodinase
MDRFTAFNFVAYEEAEMLKRSAEFLNENRRRRSIRQFSDRSFPREILENIIMTASSAPSGANKQPWTFCLIEDRAIKSEIRKAAEKEEYENYHGRMSESWLHDLEPLGTDWHKPFLETAPYLVVIFKRAYEEIDGTKLNNYYVNESVGIACGMFIMALHQAGLVTLTHTPSPMNFLQKILKRPENERPFLLLPVGFPADGAEVPVIGKKDKEEIIVRF